MTNDKLWKWKKSRKNFHVIFQYLIIFLPPKKLYPAQFFHNFERKIGHEIFVKTEKTEYLSNQLTSAHFDWKFIFPIKFGTSEQIFIFWISKMFQISGSPTVKVKELS